MATPTVETAAQNWADRIRRIQSAGMPTAPAVKIAQDDLHKVVQGATPSTDVEALSQLIGVYRNQNIYQQHKEPHGIGGFLHAATTDAASLIQNFPQGVAHAVKDTLTPSRWGELFAGKKSDPEWMKRHGYEPVHGLDIGASARNLQKSVLGNLLPGFWTLGSSKKEKMEHPVMTFLDILPFADEVTKLATNPMRVMSEGQVAELAKDSAKDSMKETLGRKGAKKAFSQLSDAEKTGLRQQMRQQLENQGIRITEKGSPAEALVEGHPFGSLWRKTARPYAYRFLEETGPLRGYTPAAKKALKYIGGSRRQLKFALDELVKKAYQDGILKDGMTYEEGVNELKKHMTWNVNDHAAGSAEALFHNQVNSWLEHVVMGDFNSPEVRIMKDGSKIEHGDQMMMIPTGKDTELPYPVKSAVSGRYAEREAKSDAYKKATKDFQDSTKKKSEIEQTNENLPRTELITKELSQRPGILGVADAAQSLIDRMKAIPELTPKARLALSHLQKAVNDIDTKGIYAGLSEVRFSTGLNSGIPMSRAFEQYAKYLIDQTKGAQKAGTQIERVGRQLNDAQRAEQEALARLSTARSAYDNAEVNFIRALNNDAHPSYHPALREAMRDDLVSKRIDEFNSIVENARNSLSGSQLKAAIDSATAKMKEDIEVLRTTKEWSQVADIVGQKLADEVQTNTLKNWRDLIDRGIRPLLLYNYDDAAVARVRAKAVAPISDRHYTPTFAKKQAFDFSPGENDFAMALTSTALESLREYGTQETVKWLTDSGLARTARDYVKELHKAFSSRPLSGKARTEGEIDGLIRRELSQYATYDEKNPFQSGHAIHIKDLNPDEMDPKLQIIPRSVYDVFHDSLEADNKLPSNAPWMKGMNLFKLAVLTGPRHFVHITAGNMVMMLIRNPEAASQLREAAQIVRAHGAGLNEAGMVMQHLWDEPLMKDPHYAAIAMQEFAAKRSLGRLVKESMLGRGVDAFQHFEGQVADMYRVAVYLQAKTDGATLEEAMARVGKIFVDMDNLTPFERSTMRQVFPFWAFTKHIMRYVFTLPADHPMRAAILSAMTRQMLEDHGSGEPDKVMQLFHIGTPTASGNVTAIDMRNINPFRSMSSPFSVAGFMQGLNPIGQEVMHAVGVDPLSATPELFPNLTLDEYTGSLKPKTPGLSPTRFITEIVPETAVLDHYIQWTDEMKQMAKNSPEAYRRQLFSTLNLPFSVATTNIYQTRARMAGNAYRVAQQDAAQAYRDRKPDLISGYQYVPFQGQVVPASALQAAIRELDKALPSGVSPKAVIPPTHASPKRRSPKKARRR